MQGKDRKQGDNVKKTENQGMNEKLLLFEMINKKFDFTRHDEVQITNNETSQNNSDLIRYQNINQFENEKILKHSESLH